MTTDKPATKQLPAWAYIFASLAQKNGLSTAALVDMANIILLSEGEPNNE